MKIILFSVVKVRAMQTKRYTHSCVWKDFDWSKAGWCVYWTTYQCLSRATKKMCMKKSPIERSNWWESLVGGAKRCKRQHTTSNPLEYMLVSSMPKVKWYRCIYNIRNLHRNFCRALWIIKRKLVKLCECERVCMCISVCVCRTKMYRTLNQVQFSI